MQPKVTGQVHSLETFGLVDGPGVRFVVFLQGCAMRCKYCHNPETWSMTGGETWTAEDLFKRAYRYKNYWKDNGGITVSGGEPLLQIDFLIEFFKLAKKQGVHTTLDTSGNPFTKQEPFYSKFKELMQYTDLVMLDLKEMDADKHKQLTGHSNENILEMAKELSNLGVDMWVRHVLVPGLTDEESGLYGIRDFLSTLSNIKLIETLPYHTLGLFKWEKIGVKYPLDGVRVPSDEEAEKAQSIINILK
jgi:pyruvate formate lyase activating enzyme